MKTIHAGDLPAIRQRAPRKGTSKRTLRQVEVVPHKLLDTLIKRMSLKNDAALSRLLDFYPPSISNIRHRKIPVGPGVLLRIHEMTEIPIAELKAWLAASN